MHCTTLLPSGGSWRDHYIVDDDNDNNDLYIVDDDDDDDHYIVDDDRDNRDIYDTYHGVQSLLRGLDIIVAVIYVGVYILDFEPNKKIFSAPRRSGPLYKEMVQVCCLAKSGEIDKRTNKIHKHSNFLDYWS